MERICVLWLLLASVSVAPCQDVVLGGTVVTPDVVLQHAWVVVKDGKIHSVSEKKPDGAGQTIETKPYRSRFRGPTQSSDVQRFPAVATCRTVSEQI